NPEISVTPKRLNPSSKEFAGLVPTGNGPRNVHGLVLEARSTGASSRRNSSPVREIAETLIFGGFFRARRTARAETIRYRKGVAAKPFTRAGSACANTS